MLLFTLRILNQVALGAFSKVKIHRFNTAGSAYYVVPFRCFPIDIDIFFHLNNAMYVRVAELARWRIFSEAKMYDIAVKQGAMFLVVKQSVEYKRPILPFQRYIVKTSVSIEDDKWLLYKHRFEEHPNDVRPGSEPKLYSVVDCKAVIKKRTGETIKTSHFLDQSEFYRKLVKGLNNNEAK